MFIPNIDRQWEISYFSEEDRIKIELLNGQNFVFSITYADDPENVGKTGKMSVKNVGKNEKNVGKNFAAFGFC